MPPKVHSVSLWPTHSFSKRPVASITLVQGYGVSGDSHAGATIQHLSRQRTNPSAPNLRQVHFISREFLSTLSRDGEDPVNPGDLGENITTSDIDVLRLGRGDRLRFVKDGVEGEEGTVVVEITGLRNPCPQIERFRKGLQEKCVVRQKEGGRIVHRKAGVMGVVVLGGEVEAGMRILVEPAEGGRVPLEVV
ncbi:pyruvate kinase-like protein [Tuber indicum]|nr:pyruvate kinase-like protein [Tuber indicum]